MTLLSSRLTLTLGALVVSIGLAPAQTPRFTRHTLSIGGNNTFSCRGTENPATLSNEITQATARIDFSYDNDFGLLDIAVLNDSPDLVGVPNPVIDAITISLPEGAVTGADLVSQSGAGGAPPNFSFRVDTDRSQPILSFNCFGNVNLLLDARGTAGGIANPNAQTFSGGRSTLTMGITTFRIRLFGPGTVFLTARTIALQFTRNQPLMVNASVNFRDGGQGGLAVGEISSPHNMCFPTVWLDKPAKVGADIRLFASATVECHTCVVASLAPGPSQVGGFQIPIGLPAHVLFLVSGFPAVPVRVPLSIPNVPSLVGTSLYMTHAAGDAGVLELSERLTLTIES